MFYSLNYDDGYVITLTQVWEDGQLCSKPLRKFLLQGDALAFREFDCPHLSESQIKILVKRYNKQLKYRRINSKRFQIVNEIMNIINEQLTINFEL